MPGTPDAFVVDERGNLIACQYGPQTRWREKLFGNARNLGDAERVGRLAAEEGLTVKQLIFCTTAEIDPSELATAQEEVKDRYGFPAEICDLRRLADDLARLYPGIAARRLGISIHLQHFMTLDAYLDSPNRRYWPHRKDVEEGKLYRPEGYIGEIEEKLRGKKRCLLTGVSGSGKTALAVAFSLWWRDNEENRRKHPEAIVFYLEAFPGYSEEMGEDWYRQMRVHDYQNELFVIDNCHLAPAAVNAFCYQWEQRRPEGALALLVSAPKVSESPWEDEPEDYFEGLEQDDAVVDVKPEQIYAGVLRTYSDAYRLADPERFVPVDIDLQDPDRAMRLERLCAHDLAGARGILEAWGHVGGRLSDVTEEVALDGLARRHLTRHKGPALVPLCSLGQFEIPAHDSFLGQLPYESIVALRRENLLVAEESVFYGQCHRVAFHPRVAAQVFRAHIRQQVGAGYESRVDNETFSCLRTYLSYCPENFTEVYYRLYRVDAIELQHRLLRDPELQFCAAKQFSTRPLDEVVWYLYVMLKVDPERAGSLLEGFFGEMTRETLRTQVLALTGRQFRTVSSFLPKMSPTLARDVLGNLPAHWVAERIAPANLSFIATWIRGTSGSLASQLGYLKPWRRELAEALQLGPLAARLEEANPETFYWFLLAFIDAAPKRAKLLLDKFPAEVLPQKMGCESFSRINSLFESLKKLGYDAAFRRRVAKSLDLTRLLTQVQHESLQKLYWVLRALKAAGPELAEHFLMQIGPDELADVFRDQGGTAGDLSHLLSVSRRGFSRSFLSQFSLDEVAAILARSPLGEVGALMERYYGSFRQSYALFASKHLPGRLVEEGIDEVGKFIARLQRQPEEGKRLAAAALQLLLTTDLTVRVAETDVEPLAALLFNAHSVDSGYSQRILAALAPSAAVEKALQHSGIRGIQLLLRNLSEMDPAFVPTIGESLRTVDLTDRMAEAEIRDLGHFLWNVWTSVGTELAQEYCRTVDARLRPQQIANADLVELGNLLWNLVHLSDAEDLRILAESVLLERLQDEWGNRPGPCARILGIILVVRPSTAKELRLPSFDFERMSEMLRQWLTELLNEGHPYGLAQTVKGLQGLDERRATDIVRKAFRQESLVDECLGLLREAIGQAVTPRSRAVLEEAIRLLQSMGSA